MLAIGECRLGTKQLSSMKPLVSLAQELESTECLCAELPLGQQNLTPKELERQNFAFAWEVTLLGIIVLREFILMLI